MTFSKNEINEWHNKFDNLRYPTKIYDELVWNGKDNPNKIELLGAWKTGCIRINNNTQNSVYTDENGIKYEYTGRWKTSTPVGFDVWRYLSDNAYDIHKNIPHILQESEPKILIEMKEKSGFGLIWSLFILHSFYPKIYPLYDQHVYRAYQYIQNPNMVLANAAPNSWLEYHKYAIFFKGLVSKENFTEINVDRALWAYGKYLKTKGSHSSTNKNINAKSQIDEKDDDYRFAFTLGGRHKLFWWKINKDFSLEIIRKFDTGNGKISLETFTEEEIEKIQQFINNDKIPLANNVENLNNGAEKEGLGKFLYEKLNKNTTQAQLASHISAMFYNSDIWDYNGKKRNMLFWKKSEDWKNLLNLYYLAQTDEVE